ncbi:MAG: peptide chain release factor H [Bacteroidetes bacterium]|nr:peptide chain release factor H [Bacteroidota bacterium]
MDNYQILQITSGRGPAECCLAVAMALREILKEARAQNLCAQVLSRTPGQEPGTLVSAIVEIQGDTALTFAKSWNGALQWIAQSPYRKFHKRKNWFIGIHTIHKQEESSWNEKDIRFKTCRSSGPGGQHVNKTETAVHATHIPSGIYVLASDSRSQALNKQTAIERLQTKVRQWQQEQHYKLGHTDPWENHHSLVRGNPQRTYKGPQFKLYSYGTEFIA